MGTKQPPKDYPVIILDLDGTLVDTCPDIVGTVKYIIDKYGFMPQSDEFIRSCIGGGARNVLLKSLGKDKEALIDAEILPLFKEYYPTHCDVYSYVYPGVAETLDYFKKTGKKLSVATYKIRSATLKIFETFDLMKYFDIIITADDVENPKPAPDCVNAILDFYTCDKSEAILVGDTKTDYMTGTNAGIDVCCVTYGYNTKEQIEALSPAYTIETFSELTKMIL